MKQSADNSELRTSHTVETQAASGLQAKPRRHKEQTSILPVFTLILWLGCLAVGAMGLSMPYSRPHPKAKEPPAIQAEMLKVQLTSEPVLPDVESPPSSPDSPPPLLEPVVTSKAPPMTAVAEPSPAIAFALPVEGPTRVVEAKQAAYSQGEAKESGPGTVAAPQSLTFGQGEGRQPAPEYPYQAQREGQEGTVLVRFSVGENGRVMSAEASTPSPWPLLNNAALRAVRQQWRFRAGPVRVYEVAIRFELKK